MPACRLFRIRFYDNVGQQVKRERRRGWGAQNIKGKMSEDVQRVEPLLRRSGNTKQTQRARAVISGKQGQRGKKSHN